MDRIPEPERMDLEEEAAAYAAADFSEVNASFVARLLALAPAHAQTLADLGCGPGDICHRLHTAQPAWRIVGIDAAHVMVRIGAGAKQLGEREPHFVEGDAKALPLRDSSFDVVCSNSILHHLSSPRAFWTEARRVAADGALLFMRDLFRPPSETAARAIVEEHARYEAPLLREEYYRSLLAAYTPAEVRHQLEEAGLHSLRVEVVTDRHMDIVGAMP